MNRFSSLESQLSELDPLNKCTKSSPLICKQVFLQSFSPKVSVISSEMADQTARGHGFASFLELLNYFEDVLAYEPLSVSKKPMRVFQDSDKVNVRFVAPIEDLFKAQQNLPSCRPNTELFSMADVDMVVKEYIKKLDRDDSSYLKISSLFSSSLTLSSFEFINHPVMQLFVISSLDSVATAKKMLHAWSVLTVKPEWLNLNDVLPLFVIVVDRKDNLEEALKLQESLKLQLGVKAVPLLTGSKDTQDAELEYPSCTTPDQDLLSIHDPTVKSIPLKEKHSIHIFLHDIISKIMIPYMQRKCRHWHEEHVVPRKSLTGRFFKSKGGLFSFGGKDADDQPLFNSSFGYYYPYTSEYQIRKLADWLFMLKDYKASYTTYELLKKDASNDKLWANLASVQEFMLYSLLIGASNRLVPFNDAENCKLHNMVTEKMIQELIFPLWESIFYNYSSRLGLKTFILRCSIVLSELFLAMASCLNNEVYYIQSLRILNRIVDGNLVPSLIRAKLMERVGYVYGHINERVVWESERFEKSELENPLKLHKKNIGCIGLPKTRRSVLWTLLAVKQLDPVSRPFQARPLLKHVESLLVNSEGERLEWLFGEGLILKKMERLSGMSASDQDVVR